MKDFIVDGILCEVTNPLCVFHTGSAPFCYDGKIITEESEVYRIIARHNGHYWSMMFDKDDKEDDIRKNFADGLRLARKRLNKKIA